MFDKHTVVINVSDTSVGTLGLGQMGLRNPLGNVPGQPNSVNVSKNAIEGATLPASDPAGNPAKALGNVLDHEFTHTSQGALGGHSDDPTNLMHEGMNPDFGGKLNDQQKQQLQEQYNRPGEVDKDKPEPQKTQEPKKEPK